MIKRFEFAGADRYASPVVKCVNAQLHVVLCQSGGGDTEGDGEGYGESIGNWD